LRLGYTGDRSYALEDYMREGDLEHTYVP